jgi:hypothetical protein
VENDLKSISISRERFLEILIDAFDKGNNGQNMTLNWMLNYLANKLK